MVDYLDEFKQFLNEMKKVKMNQLIVVMTAIKMTTQIIIITNKMGMKMKSMKL